MTERVSVVVLCYNTGAFVGEAIESALTQTLLPAEVIVVNDGSTDDSEVEIARFGSRVKVVAQPNRGVSASRNTGVRLSGGTHLAFLDADDIWPRSTRSAPSRSPAASASTCSA